MPRPMPEPERYLTVQDAAAKLGLSIDGVYRRIAARTLPFRQIGRFYRIPERELEQFMAQQDGCSLQQALDNVEDLPYGR